MIAVAIASLALAAAAIAATVYFGHALLLAHAAERVAIDLARAATLAQGEAMFQWHEAKLEAEQQRRRGDAGERRARRAEEVLNAHVRSTTINGSDDDVADLVSGMLRSPLAGPDEYHASAARDRDAALQPAAAAGAAGGRVDPGAGGSR